MKLVKISDIFDIKYGVNLTLNKLEICSNTDANCIPFVSRTEKNNGISSFVKIANDIIPNPAYTLSVACSGSILSTFYQETHYYSGHDLYILIPKFTLLKKQALLYCTFIRANKYRYSYGRQANKTLKDILIPHPDELKRFTNIKIPKQPTKTPYHNKKVFLNDREWGWFLYKDIFDIERGKETVSKHKFGNIPLISASDSNNGVNTYIKEGIKLFSGNSITVTNNGAIGSCFYQQKDYYATTDITILSSGFLNEFNSFFIIVLISSESYRFNYGRKWSLQRMQTHKIKLPITNTGNPDWQFMEDYIKALPCSSNL